MSFPIIVVTSVSSVLSFLSPVPSCAALFHPHAKTMLSSVSNIECCPPAAISFTLGTFSTIFGKLKSS